MRDIRRDTGCALDIEKGELADTRVELQEEGQRLSDTTSGTENGDLGELYNKSVSIRPDSDVGIASFDRGSDQMKEERATHISCRGREGTSLDGTEYSCSNHCV